MRLKAFVFLTRQSLVIKTTYCESKPLIEKDVIKKSTGDYLCSDGYVYFIQIQNPDGYIKIGFEGTFGARKLDLQVGNPYKLEYITRLSAKRLMEGEIHTLLKTSKLRNEWFHPSESVMECINKVISNSFYEWFYK